MHDPSLRSLLTSRPPPVLQSECVDDRFARDPSDFLSDRSAVHSNFEDLRIPSLNSCNSEKMLDVRLDQMPLYIPPLPPLVSPLKEGSSETSAFLRKVRNPASRLPDLIPLHSLDSLQAFNDHIPNTLIPYALDTLSSDKTRMSDSSLDLSDRIRSHDGSVPHNPSFHSRHSHWEGPDSDHHVPVAQQLKLNTLHPFLTHAAPDSLKTSSPSSSSSVSSMSRNCRPFEQRSSQRLSNHHGRRGSVSPDRPWRPFQAATEHVLPALLSPFHDPTFRGGDSIPGGLCTDFRDQTFCGVLPPFSWSPTSSLQAVMAADATAAATLLRFAPFSGVAAAELPASGVGQVVDPVLLPPHGFKYRRFPNLPGQKDPFCRATSPILDIRSSPGKELTSKPKKQNRVKDRQEVTSALGADSATRERLASIKKTASTQTQTQMVSFPVEGLPPPPYHTTHDTIKLDRLSTSMAPLHTPSYQHHHSHMPPPPPFTHNGFHQGSIPPPPLPPPPPPHPHSHPPRALPLISSHPASTPSPASPTSHSSSSSSPSHKPKISKAPPLYASRSPPPQYAAVARSPVDVQHAPLNLSLSSQAPPPSSPTTPTHPSVISCGSIAPPIDNVAPDKGGVTDQDILYNHRRIWSNLAADQNRDSVSQDEAIEEHFRRSLGQKYAEASSPKQTKKMVATSPQTTPSPPSTTTTVPSDTEGVSITGSVDDHFARALGNQMWTAIKAKSEPSTPETSPDTVDAHFAKALGATMWRKIQAKADEVDTDLMQPHQHLHPHHQQQQHQHKPSSSSPIHTQVAI